MAEALIEVHHQLDVIADRITDHIDCRKVIGEFIKGRKDDRIGLVVFSGYAFTQVPLTAVFSTMV